MNERDIRLECLRLATMSIDVAASRPSPFQLKSAVDLAREYYAFVWGGPQPSQTPNELAA